MFKKIFLISIYFISIIAFVFISLSFISDSPKNNITNKPIVDLVKNFYEYLDEGKYYDLSINLIEGKWSSEKNIQGKKYHSCAGVLNINEIVKKNTSKFGVGGWVLKIATLNILDIKEVPGEEFRNDFQREYEVLEKAGLLDDINNFFRVNISGHRLGRCGVVDWKRELIVISYRGLLKVVIAGVPKYLDALYSEQFFANIDF